MLPVICFRIWTSTQHSQEEKRKNHKDYRLTANWLTCLAPAGEGLLAHSGAAGLVGAAFSLIPLRLVRRSRCVLFCHYVNQISIFLYRKYANVSLIFQSYKIHYNKKNARDFLSRKVLISLCYIVGILQKSLAFFSVIMNILSYFCFHEIT
ncbi:hypothetical protein E2C01_051017 [Portunus trituberculatus]|uniref:Uncharacterized protein n=1 Tax=Portunus trituberculatus TaxID=210409 RepID=A0A5B7GHH7_PORTR|nr:hypothetical protein [Portunus trituberculatus]